MDPPIPFPLAGPAKDAAAGARAHGIFAGHLARLGISRVLDVASDTGQFAGRIRRYGYGGVIYSVALRASSFAQLVKAAAGDMRWLPLAPPLSGTRSGEVLDARIIAQVEALKIDAPGQEGVILEGYAAHLDTIRLLLVRTQGRTAPSPDDLDAFLVRGQGFTAARPEPAGDPKDPDCLWDRIYYREAPPRRPRAEPDGVTIGAVATSIGGAFHRPGRDGADVGPLWFSACVQSWRAAAPKVLSISESPPKTSGVAWLKTPDRPSAAELIRRVEPHADQHVLLVNSDILITPDLIGILPELSPDTLYCGRRHEVRPGEDGAVSFNNEGFFEWGFDYFILPPALVRQINATAAFPEHFLVGEPWWDYVLPLLALALGVPIKKLDGARTFGAHYAHTPRWSNESYGRNGESFIDLVNRLHLAPAPHAKTLLTELAEPRETLEKQLGYISRSICQVLP